MAHPLTRIAFLIGFLLLSSELPLAHAATVWCTTNSNVCSAPPYAGCDGTNCAAICANPSGNGYSAYGTPVVSEFCGDYTCTQAFTNNALLTVTTLAGEGGSISPSAPQTAAQGQAVAFTLTPNAGFYVLDTYQSSCPIQSYSQSALTTGPIYNDCVVSVRFNANYTVSTSLTAGGTISPTNKILGSGSATSFTITPSAGYGISSVTGCGGTLVGTTYTTGPVTSDCTVSVVFGLPVSTSAGLGGQITPASKYIGVGSTDTFTITPLAGYTIASASGCGGSLSGNTYTTGPISAVCTVSATFSGSATGTITCYDSWGWTDACEMGAASGCVGTDCAQFCTNPPAFGMISTSTATDYDDWEGAYSCGTVWTGGGGTYTVTPSVYGGGTISPNTAQSVSPGGTKAFTLSPNAGYAIYNVTGTCGGTLSGSTFTTNAANASCTVIGNFSAAAADGYRVNSGQELMINAHTVCKKITNNNASAIFVPAKTANEWLQFRTNASGITQSNCP